MRYQFETIEENEAKHLIRCKTYASALNNMLGQMQDVVNRNPKSANALYSVTYIKQIKKALGEED